MTPEERINAIGQISNMIQGLMLDHQEDLFRAYVESGEDP